MSVQTRSVYVCEVCGEETHAPQTWISLEAHYFTVKKISRGSAGPISEPFPGDSIKTKHFCSPAHAQQWLRRKTQTTKAEALDVRSALSRNRSASRRG